jgi:DNA-binding transcriptional LysR family regulator
MYLSLDELRSFVVLAAELHFRKAAERLFVSQPGLSKQIRRLEEKVGGLLFARTRRRVVLLEAGRVLLPLAEDLLNRSEAARVLTKDAIEGRVGTLRIGFGIASVAEILPRTIQRFRQEYPRVQLQMLDMSTPAQIAALLQDQIDIGIVRLPIAHTELASLPLFHERLVMATPPGMTYKRREGLASLRDRPFILQPRSESVTFHDHVLALCRQAGFTQQVFQEASELFTILNLVRAGLGVSLVPRAALRMSVPGVRFRELRMPDAEWRIGIAWNRLSLKLDLVSRFCATIRTVVRNQRAPARFHQDQSD